MQRLAYLSAGRAERMFLQEADFEADGSGALAGGEARELGSEFGAAGGLGPSGGRARMLAQQREIQVRTVLASPTRLRVLS